MSRIGEPVAKFWSKIDVRGADDCWPCLLAPLWSGYCTTRYMTNEKRTAHAIAYEIATGDKFGPGEVACHRCDNRVCCNPAHVFKGTYSDNTLDMLAKGRANREPGVRRKLTIEQAEEIRREYSTGEFTQVELAERYGIAAQNISLLVQGRSYTGQKRPPRSEVSKERFRLAMRFKRYARMFAALADAIRESLNEEMAA